MLYRLVERNIEVFMFIIRSFLVLIIEFFFLESVIKYFVG